MGKILANPYPQQPATETGQDVLLSLSAPTPKELRLKQPNMPFPNFNWHKAFLTSDRYLRINVSYGNALEHDLEAVTGKTVCLKS